MLTHPHKDHYLGFDQIIDHFLGHIDRVCFYAGDGLREYIQYLAKQDFIDPPGLRPLKKIMDRITQSAENGAHIVRIGESTEILRRGNYGGNNVEILGLSPSARSAELYRNLLYAAIPKKEEDVLNYLSDSEHNLISSAVWCSINNVRLIFGGDVEAGEEESTGWRGIIHNPNCPDLSAHVIKVAHHGSSGAFHKKAWEKHSAGICPISIITPYNRLLEPLPRDSDKDKVAQYSDRVIVTHKTKFVKQKKIYNPLVVKQSIGIKKWKCLVENDSVGYINTEISTEDGSLINLDIREPAYIYYDRAVNMS